MPSSSRGAGAGAPSRAKADKSVLLFGGNCRLQQIRGARVWQAPTPTLMRCSWPSVLPCQQAATALFPPKCNLVSVSPTSRVFHNFCVPACEELHAQPPSYFSSLSQKTRLSSFPCEFLVHCRSLSALTLSPSGQEMANMCLYLVHSCLLLSHCSPTLFLLCSAACVLPSLLTSGKQHPNADPLSCHQPICSLPLAITLHSAGPYNGLASQFQFHQQMPQIPALLRVSLAYTLVQILRVSRNASHDRSCDNRMLCYVTPGSTAPAAAGGNTGCCANKCARLAAGCCWSMPANSCCGCSSRSAWNSGCCGCRYC